MRMNKKHWRTNDNGLTWLPKQAFETEDDINRIQYPEHKYVSYRCDECFKLHLGTVDKFQLSNVDQFLSKDSDVTAR